MNKTDLTTAFEQTSFLYGGNAQFIEQRYAAAKSERLPELAEELARLKLDVFVVFGPPAAVNAIKKVTSSVPIVMTVAPDPVRDGLVASLAHPGGQVTGLSDLHSVLVPKRLEILETPVPSASRFAVLTHPDNPTLLRQMKDIEAAAPAFSDPPEVFYRRAFRRALMARYFFAGAAAGAPLAPGAAAFADAAAAAGAPLAPGAAAFADAAAAMAVGAICGVTTFPFTFCSAM